VLHISGVLHGSARTPLCAKALQRRAAALQALGQHGRAVADLEGALDALGGADAEVERQLARARAMAEEAARQRRAMAAVSGHERRPLGAQNLPAALCARRQV
jgi:hypothetical protein